MRLSERFETGTDDVDSLGFDVDQTYDCKTCGAIVAQANLVQHNEWHEQIEEHGQ